MGTKERSKVAMTDAEVRGYIERSRTATLASIGADGRPHLVAMWFAVIDGEIWFETKSRSQKAVNLRRDPRVTVLIEDGETYDGLRGVSIDGTAEVVEDPEPALGGRGERVGTLQRPIHRRGQATRGVHVDQAGGCAGAS